MPNLALEFREQAVEKHSSCSVLRPAIHEVSSQFLHPTPSTEEMIEGEIREYRITVLNVFRGPLSNLRYTTARKCEVDAAAVKTDLEFPVYPSATVPRRCFSSAGRICRRNAIKSRNSDIPRVG